MYVVQMDTDQQGCNISRTAEQLQVARHLKMKRLTFVGSQLTYARLKELFNEKSSITQASPKRMKQVVEHLNMFNHGEIWFPRSTQSANRKIKSIQVVNERILILTWNEDGECPSETLVLLDLHEPCKIQMPQWTLFKDFSSCGKIVQVSCGDEQIIVRNSNEEVHVKDLFCRSYLYQRKDKERSHLPRPEPNEAQNGLHYRERRGLSLSQIVCDAVSAPMIQLSDRNWVWFNDKVSYRKAHFDVCLHEYDIIKVVAKTPSTVYLTRHTNA